MNKTESESQKQFDDVVSEQMRLGKYPIPTLESTIASLGGTLTPQPEPRKSFGEWLYRIFRPCDHQWHTINVEKTSRLIEKPVRVESPPFSEEPFETHEWIVIATVYHLRCKLCGNVKSRKVGV